MPRFLLTLLILVASVAVHAANPFFAMDNIARGGPDVAPAMLKELGYEGFGGRVPDKTMLPAVRAQGLKFYNGYHVIELTAAKPAPNEQLRTWIDAMHGQEVVLWLAINKVFRADGTPYAVSSSDADELVLGQLRAIADTAAVQGVKIALYPHAGFWLARVEDALRVADQLNRPEIGVTFNLCHWLKVEGSERNPVPVLRSALPRLMFVTINGADTGDTRAMGWDRLIQPLDTGTYDVAAFIGSLKSLGYIGPVGFQGYNIKGEPRDILARTISAWRKINAAR
jgi:sugar phosphate isomerase/epimerase